MILDTIVSIWTRLSGHIDASGASQSATVTLIIVQVSIGVVLKLAQDANGEYPFSPAASLTISEACKCLVAVFALCLTCLARGGTILLVLPAKERDSHWRRSVEHGIESKKCYQNLDNGETSEFEACPLEHLMSIVEGRDIDAGEHFPSTSMSGLVRPLSFTQFFRHQLEYTHVKGLMRLALLDALVNNMTFVLFQLADPGTVSLVKSSITLAFTVLGSAWSHRASKHRYAALACQVCAVLATQYHPFHGLLYHPSIYVLLALQAIASAYSSLHEQKLVRKVPVSLHAGNVVLYSSGIAINLVLYLATCAVHVSTPSFLQGQFTKMAFLFILCNVLIGTAVTAIRKHADNKLIWLATYFSTGILLYLAPFAFTIPSHLTVAGNITMIAGVWIHCQHDRLNLDRFSATLPRSDGKFGDSRIMRARTLLDRFALKTILLVVALLVLVSGLSVLSWPSTTLATGQQAKVIESPLKNVMAFVRFNHRYAERIELVKEYTPFFKTVHISMADEVCSGIHNRNNTECPLPRHSNAKYDNWAEGMFPYVPMARMMQKMLDAPEGTPLGDTRGIFFYHFDAWVDPMGFTDMDQSKIWFPSKSSSNWTCYLRPEDKPSWWAWDEAEGWSQQNVLPAATRDAWEKLDPALRQRINPSEWCSGWSDIYYVPRRFFNDWILLSYVYYHHRVVHEIVIPTMLHTIDMLRRVNEMSTHDVVTRLDDCWGGCCQKNPTEQDVLQYRCGHKLDLLQQNVTRTFYDRLDEHAKMLGGPLDRAVKARVEGETIVDPTKIGEVMAKAWPTFVD